MIVEACLCANMDSIELIQVPQILGIKVWGASGWPTLVLNPSWRCPETDDVFVSLKETWISGRQTPSQTLQSRVAPGHVLLKMVQKSQVPITSKHLELGRPAWIKQCLA